MRKAFPASTGISPAIWVWIVAATVAFLAAGPARSAQPPKPKAGKARAAAVLPAPNPLAALTTAERSRCVEVARHTFQDVLGQDRHTVISVVPVYRRAGDTFPRTCKVELFDYPKNLDLQATIELTTGAVVSSRRLQDLQPPAGKEEIAAARRIGEAGAGTAGANAPQAAARIRLGEILRLPGLEVSAMVRGDDKQCFRHRCIEVSYFQRGPDAGKVPAAEPAGTQVPWQAIQRRARVVVDLTSGTALSTEVF